MDFIVGLLVIVSVAFVGWRLFTYLDTIDPRLITTIILGFIASALLFGLRPLVADMGRFALGWVGY